MQKHHIIISGTGRSGTTFLMQLLTHLGMETGFDNSESHVHSHCRAGMELDIRDPNAPYVIKSPWLCAQIDELLDSGALIVDHAFIPMRDLYSAAQSRRHVSAGTDASLFEGGHVPGGVWLTEDADKQESVLAEQFYHLMQGLTKHGVATTLLAFPKLVHDPRYLYDSLSPILGDIDYETFLVSYRSVVRPEWVHDFVAAR